MFLESGGTAIETDRVVLAVIAFIAQNKIIYHIQNLIKQPGSHFIHEVQLALLCQLTPKSPTLWLIKNWTWSIRTQGFQLQADQRKPAIIPSEASLLKMPSQCFHARQWEFMTKVTLRSSPSSHRIEMSGGTEHLALSQLPPYPYAKPSSLP